MAVNRSPAGWNRVLLEVQNLPARIADLKEAGLRFRNEMEIGPGGKQIQLKIPTWGAKRAAIGSTLLALSGQQQSRAVVLQGCVPVGVPRGVGQVLDIC